MKLFRISLVFILLSLIACEKDDESKPNNVIIAERVSAVLQKNSITKIYVFKRSLSGDNSISQKVDFKVEDGYLVFLDNGNMISYMNFDKLITYRLSDTYAELYFGF